MRTTDGIVGLSGARRWQHCSGQAAAAARLRSGGARRLGSGRLAARPVGLSQSADSRLRSGGGRGGAAAQLGAAERAVWLVSVVTLQKSSGPESRSLIGSSESDDVTG